jgi:hypothetical protein
MPLTSSTLLSAAPFSPLLAAATGAEAPIEILLAQDSDGRILDGPEGGVSARIRGV